MIKKNIIGGDSMNEQCDFFKALTLEEKEFFEELFTNLDDEGS